MNLRAILAVTAGAAALAVTACSHTSAAHAVHAAKQGPPAYLGRWHAYDYELCIGQALDLTSATATSNPPCSGDSTSGWERMAGCSYPSGGCGFAWIALTFARHADGTVTATPSAAPVAVPGPDGGSFYDDGLTICTLNSTGKIVPCNADVTGIPPEGLTPGSQQLSLVNSGVLKVRLPQGYWAAPVMRCAASRPRRPSSSITVRTPDQPQPALADPLGVLTH